MLSPHREVGAGGRAAPHRSEELRGESGSVANNLLGVSCLTMEKSHVVRGSKNRLGKLLTTSADVKGKARATPEEEASPGSPASPGVNPQRCRPRSRAGTAAPRRAARPGQRLTAPLSSVCPRSVPGRTSGAGARSGRLCLTVLPPDPDL